jgi:hypothetical protein
MVEVRSQVEEIEEIVALIAADRELDENPAEPDPFGLQNTVP